jgi:hypothetical protein
MTASVQRLLDSYDSLSDAEKHEASVELLRRIVGADLPEDTLLVVADELFRELDAREAEDAQR